MREMRKIARIYQIAENTDLDPLCGTVVNRKRTSSASRRSWPKKRQDCNVHMKETANAFLQGEEPGST